MLLLTSNFKELCESSTVYLDTNAFIFGAANNELSDLYVELANSYKTVFVTLNSVEYEFTRGSQTLGELTDRRDYVRSIATILNINKLIDNDKNDAFSVAMSLTIRNKDSQYTDYLLAVAMHAYRSSVHKQFVLSADTRAFPLDIFTVEGSITFNTSRSGVSHMNLYSLDDGKYLALLKKIAK